MKEKYNQLSFFLKDNPSLKYIFSISFYLIIFLFFVTSNLFFAKDKPVVEAARETIKVENSIAYEVLNKYKNENETEVAFLVAINPMKTTNREIGEITIVPKLKNATIQNATVEYIKGSDFLFVVDIKDLPEKWDAVQLNIKDSNSNNFVSFVMNRNDNHSDYLYTTISKQTFLATKEYAELESAKYELTLLERQRKEKITNQIEKLENQISQKQKELETIEQDTEYKTDKQLKEREQNIQNYQIEIERLKREIGTLESDESEFLEREQNISKKIEDIKTKYNL
ncbi:hypothetical protein SAMN05421767_10416 [Granulicatella balaenopterae]|uniref:Uncharacterized protein n=1 Tax=Granulicatella balaenopterae TaxID=137733 RepID=A0A1H9I0B3_9LACT|nr:hypothetical protein [Granulicatella balaenopterae]SEQ68089.1 hypothetical protein SAMN05421767_10416 [Granulicatella balaenopterae]